MPTCPDGHATDASDYCSVCGAPMRTSAAPASCPVCGASISGRFCESCGHDSALPEPAADPASTGQPFEWTAVVTADKDYYKRVIARGGPDTVEFPEVFPERRILLQGSTLIGRNNRKQGVEPGIDLGIHPVDRGVSTQHAVLQIRESGLTITDLGSTNGTSVNESDDLLGNGQETPLVDGDRVHVGAWTTITVTKSEKSRT
jgi:FHA domain-containing protein